MRRFKRYTILDEFKFVPFLPLKPIALILSLSVPVNYLFHDRYTIHSTRVAWAWASLITSTLMFCAVILFKKYLQGKSGRKIRLTAFIIITGFFGALKGVASVVLVSQFAQNGKVDLAELFIRGWSGASVGAGLAFALALFAVYKSSFHDLRLEITNENQQLANDLIELRDEIMILRSASEEKIVQRILKNIDIRSGIDIFAEDPEKNWKKISDALHTDITKRVRQQSHELAQISQIKPSFKKQQRSVIRLQILNLHPKVFALLQFSMGSAIYYTGWNPRNSSILIALNTATTLLVTTLFRDLFFKIKATNERRNKAVFFCLILTIEGIFALNQFSVGLYKL